MPKEKTVVPIDPTLRAPALALRVFEKEVEKRDRNAACKTGCGSAFQHSELYDPLVSGGLCVI